MNIKEYREFKINKYPDSKTGLLMYRHEKLYDIVTTIEQFVNISFSSNAIDQEKYIEQYNNLIKDLPKEYNRKYGNIFNRFIKKYNNANNIEKKYNSNFRKKLKKIMGINNLTKELSHYLHIKNIDINNILLKRYGGNISILLEDSDYKKIDSGSSGLYNNNLYTTFINYSQQNTEETMKHEHFHHLANLGLIDDELKSTQDNSRKITEESIMYYRIKNELIAQYSDYKNTNVIEAAATDIIIDQYIVSYLSTLYKKDLYYEADYISNSINKSISKMNEQELIQFNQELIKEKEKDNDIKNIITIKHLIYEKINSDYKISQDQEILNKFHQYREKSLLWRTMLFTITNVLYSKIIPDFFDSYEQVIYLFAITPLSQWKGLVKYYSGLTNLYKTKKDLHSTLSNPHE